MPKAEVGSVKHLSNMMKRKGLQRLRWYCQACEKQCPSENAFKQHTMSESHVRRMLLVGQNASGAINEFSADFLKAFVQQLRTAHGEKSVQINHFYQEYIARKDHVHMNATRWSSLTEFAKYLGKEGICRVEETDKGLHISWIDTSPEALRRQDALRRKEMMDRGDDAWEQRMLQEQIKRANRDAESRGAAHEHDEAETRTLQRHEGDKVKLSFGSKPQPSGAKESTTAAEKPRQDAPAADGSEKDKVDASSKGSPPAEGAAASDKPAEAKPLSLKLGAKPQSKNVFAQAKKNAFANGNKKAKIEQPKKMSEAERIMREEMEKKRPRDSLSTFAGLNKRQRT